MLDEYECKWKKEKKDDSKVLSLKNGKDNSIYWNIEKCKNTRFGGKVGVQFWYFKFAMYMIHSHWISDVQKDIWAGNINLGVTNV